MLTEVRPFRIVTHRTWLAEIFTRFGAVQDFGFDIDPETAEKTIWWAPGAWVACVYQSGIKLPLTLCGHRWMEELPEIYRGRDIKMVKIQDVQNVAHGDPDEQVHVKLPEAKIDSFPAKLRLRKYLADTLAQHHVPPDTLLQISKPVTFVRECRFWIAKGEIMTYSWYLVDDVLWDHEDFQDGTAAELGRMYNFVERLLDDSQVSYPNGFVLDVGLTDDNRVLVVEANAAWSSSPYNGWPEGIVESIVASHDFSGTATRKWRWTPNPVYGTVQPIKWAQPAVPE